MMNSTTMQRQKRIITHITHYALLLLIILVFKNVKYTERQKEKSLTNTGILVYFHTFYHIVYSLLLFYIAAYIWNIEFFACVWHLGEMYTCEHGCLYFSMSMWRQEANFFCCLSLTFCLDWLASKALECLSFHIPVLGECRILSPSYTQYAMPFLPSPQGHVLTPSTYLKPCTPLNTMSLPICPQC